MLREVGCRVRSRDLAIRDAKQHVIILKEGDG
jgi:hypothetical protein